MSNLLDQSKSILRRNASTILTVIGGVGIVATAVLSAKATPKALALLEEAEKEADGELTKWEVIKVAAPAYIPAVVTGVSTLACIFGANVFSKHQQASIASAYALIDNSYKAYKNKLKELYGKEAHNNIVDAIAVEKAEEIGVYNYGPVSLCNLSVEDGTSEPRLFYDEFSNRYFETTIEQVINAEYHFNRNFVLRGYAFLNELYEFLGLEQTDYGDKVGWSTDDETYWVEFNHRKALMDNDTLEAYIIETPYGPTLEAVVDYQ